jgi:hypothetical protein
MARFLGIHTCVHEWQFIFSSRGTGTDGSHRHEAHVCKNCGLFRVWGDVDFKRFDIQFTLNTPELVAAAGAYLPLIDPTKRLTESE